MGLFSPGLFGLTLQRRYINLSSKCINLKHFLSIVAKSINIIISYIVYNKQLRQHGVAIHSNLTRKIYNVVENCFMGV